MSIYLYSISHGFLSTTHSNGKSHKLLVLKDSTGCKIKLKYELGRSEFDITYLYMNRATGKTFTCKSILKKKLRTAVDIKDVRSEREAKRVRSGAEGEKGDGAGGEEEKKMFR